MLDATYHYDEARHYMIAAQETQHQNNKSEFLARSQIHATLALVAAQVKS